MGRQEDTKVLIVAPNSRKRISQKAVVACLIFGIAFISLLIYGFIIALDLKSRPFLNPDDLSDDPVSDLNNSPAVCPQVEFDYLLLAVRWPVSDCTGNQCVPKIPDRWLIHGLWPNYANGSWPQNCCHSTPFRMEEVQKLEPRLREVWPNLLKGHEDSSLWEHEWNKHGTCSTKNPIIRGELNYFNHTLSLFDAVHVSEWLKSGQIVPGPKVVRKTTLKSLLRSKVGKEATVHCASHKSGSSVEMNATTATPSDRRLENLESIHFCYDKTSITPIDCPDHDNCPEEMQLPSAV